MMPFLFPLCGLVCGIIIGFKLHSPLWGLLPVAGGLMYYIVLLKQTSIPYLSVVINYRHYIWITSVFLGIGIFNSWFHQPMRLSSETLDRWCVIRGTVDQVTSGASGDRFIMQVDVLVSRKCDPIRCRNLNILLYTRGLSAGKGDILQATGIIEQITDSKNYRPSGFAERLSNEGILYSMHVDPEHVKVIGFVNSPTARAMEFRDRMIGKLETSGLKRPTIQFLAALLFGDRTLFLSENQRVFSHSGTAHVLALSGMHVGIIMSILLFILFPLKFLGFNFIRYWIAVLLLWGYTVLSGLSPSTVRAAIMITFIVGGLTIQRKNSSANALLASAMVILIFDPWTVFDVGMQLSFICVASILAFATTLNTVGRRSHPLTHSAVSALLVSLIATLATWVLVSYYFKVVPILFLPANLLLLPLLPVYMSIALVYVAFLNFGVDCTFLTRILDSGYEFVIKMASILSAHGESTITYQVQLPVVIIWLLGVLFIGIAIKKNRKPILMAGFSLLASAFILIPILHRKSPDGLIIQKQFSELAITIYEAEKETVEVLPRNTISRLNHKNHEIVSIDCKADIDSLLRILSFEKKRRKKYLLVGSNAGNIQVNKILEWNGFEKIILHSSLKRRMEEDILGNALEYQIDRIYSLHDEGPFRLDFLPEND